MNKRFEQEYREFMEKNTPDIWDRIEAGVASSQRANSPISSDAPKEVLQTKKIERFPKGKRPSNYYQLMAVAGAAACFALLAIGSPVVRESMRIDRQAQEGNEAPEEETQIEERSSKMTDTDGEKTSDGRISAKEEASDTQAVSEGSEVKAEETEAEASSSIQQVKQDAGDDVKTEEKDPVQSSAVKDVSPEPQMVQTGSGTQSVEVKSGTTSVAEEKASTSSQKKKKKKSSSSEAPNYIASVQEVEGNTISSAVNAKSGSSSAAASGSSSAYVSSSSSALSESSSAKTTGAADEAAAAREVAEAAAAAAKAAQETAEAAAAEAEKAQAEASGSSEKKQETVVYSDVKVKVSSVKGSNGEIIYTLKVIEDGSGSFKKGKSLKMVSSTDLQKGCSYVISFADDGSKTGSKTLYTVLLAEAVPED